jgi:hypothetical protein
MLFYIYIYIYIFKKRKEFMDRNRLDKLKKSQKGRREDSKKCLSLAPGRVHSKHTIPNSQYQFQVPSLPPSKEKPQASDSIKKSKQREIP